MYTIINGSPKINKSNSACFLEIITKSLDDYNLFELKKDSYEKVIDSINKSDTIVLAFPLYVDSPPTKVLSLLDYIIDNKINLKNKLIYIVVNCGFREGIQNKTAVDIVKLWCKKTNATYMSSIQIGAGEIIGNKKYKLLSITAIRKLKKFSKIIKRKQKYSDIITTVNYLNNKTFCYVANIFWNKNAKTNNLSEHDIREK